MIKVNVRIVHNVPDLDIIKSLQSENKETASAFTLTNFKMYPNYIFLISCNMESGLAIL